MPFPVLAAWMVVSFELAGGIFMIMELPVAIVNVPQMSSMLVAVFTLHIHYEFSSVKTVELTPSGPAFGPPGYEINLLSFAGLIGLALSSPTTGSVDRSLFRERTNLGAPGTKFQGESSCLSKNIRIL